MKSGAFVAVDGDSVHAHTEHRVGVRWCMGRGMRRVESTKMPGTPWLAKRGTKGGSAPQGRGRHKSCLPTVHRWAYILSA